MPIALTCSERVRISVSAVVLLHARETTRSALAEAVLAARSATVLGITEAKSDGASAQTTRAEREYSLTVAGSADGEERWEDFEWELFDKKHSGFAR